MRCYYFSSEGGLEISKILPIVLSEKCICHNCERLISEETAAVELTAWDGVIYVICPK